MTIPDELRERIRQRANLACEYCGVTEVDTGGLLTLDHFQPQAHGGDDDARNLFYCCHACNSYKADYWPTQPTDIVLWNPRREPREVHMLALADGMLHPITATGAWTVKRLRLNRPPLVAYRRAKQSLSEERRLLTRYRDLVSLLENLQQQQAALLEEHHALLEEHRALLRLMLSGSE